MSTQMQETTVNGESATSTLHLDQLVREINEEHHATEQAIRDGLAHARRAGELLNHAKDKLMYGEFMPWVERNCEFSHRTATMYMRIAREWDRISANWQSVANMGITEVDQWLSCGDVDAAATTAGETAAVERVAADPLETWLSSIAEALEDAHAALVALRNHAVGRIEVRERDVRAMLTLVEQLLAYHEKMQARRWKLLGRWPAGTDLGLFGYLAPDERRIA